MSYVIDLEKKELAHRVLNRAILLGLVKRPDSCSRCGVSDQTIVGHHWNYDHPLDVEWVCNKCHLVVIHDTEGEKITLGLMSCIEIKKKYDYILASKLRKPVEVDDSEVIDVVKEFELED